jgi:RNA-directed DNA polymerase
MRESHVEGPASHDDPESCATPREGGGEALTGAHAGREIEPRNHINRGADAVHRSGRPHGRARFRKRPTDPARSKTPRTRGTSRRENREIPWLPEAKGASGRTGKAEAERR